MSQQKGAQCVLESQPRELIGGEASRGDEVTERTLQGLPPMGTLCSRSCDDRVVCFPPILPLAMIS